jgi:hypothetical protein
MMVRQGDFMSLRNRLVVLIAALLSLSFLVACGSSTPKAAPPPSGSFSDKNLNGTYVFSVTGSDPNGYFQTIAGTFTADGNGGITGGVIELGDAGAGLLSPTAVTGGVYNVGVDGRGGFSKGGGITLQTQSAGNFTFDFVLSSSDHGLITEYDSYGTGSGTLDLQSTVTQSDINGKSYAFNFSGSSGVGYFCGTSLTGNMPFATVGAFALDSNGDVSPGIEDINNNCTSVGGTSGVAITGGSVILCTSCVGGPGTGPSTATITSSAGTFTYDVYPVDATHLKFIESDGHLITAGDAFTQVSAIPTGDNVFIVAGYDFVASGPFTAAGLIDANGGVVMSDSVEDINDVGSPSELNFSGSYSGTGGRLVLDLSGGGFVNGGGGLACSSCTFAAYPSSGGLQLLEIDNGGMTGGVAYPQSATSLASSAGYGMNLTGVNSNGEEDDIAEFTNNNGAFTGLIDFNDQGQLSYAQRFSSTYSADGTVPGRGVVTPVSNASFNLVTYVVDNSTVVLVETDNNQVGLGSLVEQSASAASNAATRHLSVLRLAPRARGAWKRR